MIKYNEKYHFEFAQKDGQDYKYRFILTTGKPLSTVNIDQIIAKVGGVDVFQVVGLYSIEIVIAKTFDVETLIEAFKKELETAVSDIVVPKIVV